MEKRSQLAPIMALLKKTLTSFFDAKVLRVEDTMTANAISQLSQKLDAVERAVKGAARIEMKGTPASINIQPMGEDTIRGLTDEIKTLKAAIDKIKLTLPSVQRVEVTNQKQPEKVDLSPLLSSLQRLERAVTSIRLEAPIVPAQREIKIPEFPKAIGLTAEKAILSALKDLKDALDELPKKIPQTEIPRTVSIDNFPPQKVPMPVTHININALHGLPLSSAVSVGTTATPLPATALENRRSVVIYNNSSSPLYIGGSNVTTTNGMIVPANSYSPAIDAGEDLIVYGIASTGTINARVLEISNRRTGE